MSNKKICVSVFAESLAGLKENIITAAEYADVIELRLDKLKSFTPSEIGSLENFRKPLLLTYRSRAEGGEAPEDPAKRIAFWNELLPSLAKSSNQYLIDNELDIADDLNIPDEYKCVRSYHDFSGSPANIEDIYTKLSSGGGIAKLVITAKDITDTIPLWLLLEKANVENRDLVPIAMGESGKITRLLAPARGSFLTYAALGGGKTTAPGQFTADEMHKVFRINELNTETNVYGVIAGDTAYSLSPYIHNAAFANLKINSVFVPLQVADIASFFARMVREDSREVDLNFCGFAVTNPHKQSIIPLLDDVDETAKKIGAVNTVYFKDGRILGTNTDGRGFITPLLNKFGSLKNSRIAVVGAGGAARACVYELANSGAQTTVFARDLTKAAELADAFGQSAKLYQKNEVNLFHGFDIIVDTTPLGTSGTFENETIASAEMMKGVKLVYDLVYTPERTVLLTEADNAGIDTLGGLEMLITQGAFQSELWTGRAAPTNVMMAAAQKQLASSQ